jgi:hypothetical protein
MSFQVLRVPTFGGGLDFSANAAELKPDQWSFSNGWHARDNYAEVGVAMQPGSFVTYLGANYGAIGLVPNPWAAGGTTDPPVLVVAQDNGGLAKLWRVNPPSTATEITATGSKPLTDSGVPPIATSDYAYLENNLYITWGLPSTLGGGAACSVVQLAPAAGGVTPSTYTLLSELSGAAITGSLSPAFLETCRDHLVAGAVDRIGASNTLRTATRTVAWCDSLTPQVWDTLMFNSAQTYEVTELPYGITGIARADADTVLVFSTDRILILKYTGSNPPFTRHLATLGGNIQGVITSNLPSSPIGARGGVASTPLGVVWYGDDDIYLWQGGPKAIGNPIRNYLREKASRTVRVLNPVWHGHWGLLLVPVMITATNCEMFMWDPLTGAWSRRVMDFSSKAPVAQVYAPTGDSANGQWAGRWLACMSDGHVIGENPDMTQPFAGAFVDTKDFAFDDVMGDAYIDRIKIDWEPLTNSTTDSIRVSSVARNHYGNILGGISGEQDETANFSFALNNGGTLTGSGQSELQLRIRAKFVRFRFTQLSGRARIRGFAIRWQRASDRSA